MDPSSVGNESFILRYDSLKFDDSQTDSKIRIKTVSKLFPGPFQPGQRVQRKHNLLVKGQPPVSKSEEKNKEGVLLPNLYSIMHQIVREKAQLGAQQGDERNSPRGDVPAIEAPIRPDQARKAQSKDLLLRGNSLEFDNKKSKPAIRHKYSLSQICNPSAVRLRRNSVKHIRIPKRTTMPALVPEITLTVAENKIEETEPQRLNRSSSHLKMPLPELRRDKLHHTMCSGTEDTSPTGFLKSPSFSQHSSQSSIRSSNFSERDSSMDEVFDDTQTIERAGVWQPWSSSLTPFHELMEMHPQRQSRVHRYLRKLKSSSISHSPIPDFKPGIPALIESKVKCSCVNPMHLRNLRKFCVQGIHSLHFTLYQRKLCKLQQLIKPADPPNPVMLIHVEGVVMDFQKLNQFDSSPIAFALRPGAVEGLRQLSKTFSLVFLSASPVPRFYKVLEYLIQNRVQLAAAYSIQTISADDWQTEQYASCFQDYSQIFTDLGIKDHHPQRVLLLTALRAELDCKGESAIYSSSGIKVRIHARHLPVVMPTRTVPIIAVLVPHLRIEGGDALRFPVIAYELQRIFNAVPLYNLEEAFHLRSCGDLSPLTTYIRTHRVHEAYYSYLLPLMRCEDWDGREEDPEKDRKSRCNAHPMAYQVSRLIPENRIVILSSTRSSDLSKPEIIDFDPLDLKSKHLNLLSFATSNDE